MSSDKLNPSFEGFGTLELFEQLSSRHSVTISPGIKITRSLSNNEDIDLRHSWTQMTGQRRYMLLPGWEHISGVCSDEESLKRLVMDVESNPEILREVGV